MFCGHAAADREGIGYHSLTPNTFTADTMINESGAVLQGLFLGPLDSHTHPSPNCPATSTTTSPSTAMLDPFHLDRNPPGDKPGWDVRTMLKNTHLSENIVKSL